jgi:tRNA(fMet)-specific endonuclease VapC
MDYDAAAISIITLAELKFGAYNSARVEYNLKRVDFIARNMPVLALSEVVARRYAEIKASLRRSGTPLADFDIMIGATAIENDLTLVTNNEKHFARIENLRVENWIK